MIHNHEAWDKAIGPRIDDLRIDISENMQPAIDPVTASLRRYGFALLSGLGTSKERDATACELLDFATRLGDVVPQSPRGEEVEDVRDFSDIEVKDERGYRSRGELSPHSDPPTLIALHCLHRARSGGESYIVNVRAIHDRIADLAPELLEELYRGFPHWQVEGQPRVEKAGPAPDKRAIFALNDEIISCVYYRPFIEMAATALGEPLTGRQINVLDLFDKCSSSPDLAVRFHLQPGQTLLLHNRTVLHARTDYEDWPEPERRRHLLRVWIDAPKLLPVAPQHELGDLFEEKVT
ncbi:TauD/TfdA family dioxygenase [Gammaproteobacteria bacterium]|nr:TauD/TfdA family dioxygenase [Gammaproteobacteria bacterium]